MASMIIQRSALVAVIAMIGGWGCSGTTTAANSGNGGNSANGGSPAGGATISTTNATGGSTTGGVALGGAPGSGGSPAAGGTSAQGESKATGGSSQAGGAVSVGGSSTTGGTSATGGASASGGAKATTGGASTTGGVNTGGSKATGGGTNSTSGGATATGGNGPGGTTGVGGTAGAGVGGGSSSVICPATVMKSGDSTQKVGTRNYILHIPTGYAGTKPLPLVIDFHALGGTGSQQKSLSGWDKKGDSVGFITAFPDSASNGGNGWNVGMCCQDAQKNKVDDAGFVRDMIKAIQAMACVDPKRIYVSGCSNGGGMSYKTACDLADIVAAAAPVDFRCVYGGTTASPSCEGCKPARPISIIHFDNTGDTSLVPYNGGMTSFAADCPPNQSCTGMGFPSAEANFATWQQLDQCTGSAATDSAHASCKTNSTCQGSTQVTMCVQQGGSHCGNYGSLKIVDTAWDYFQKLSLP